MSSGLARDRINIDGDRRIDSDGCQLTKQSKRKNRS